MRHKPSITPDNQASSPLTGGLMDLLAQQNQLLPLAEVLRPSTLDQFLGQGTVLGSGKPLRNLIQGGQLTSMVLWGPPGVGKTTFARLLANHATAHFTQLSAVHSGVTDLRQAVSVAKDNWALTGQPTVLFLDEIHRYSKTQQDALLPHVENGTVVLIGATTENPSFQIVPALLSRVLLVRFNFLEAEHIETLLARGLVHLQQQAIQPLVLAPDVIPFIVAYANGDGRSALNLLELGNRCATLSPNPDGVPYKTITLTLLEQLVQQARLNYDRDGDGHYDIASAYQKSMRGSDENAALYWLGAMIAAGEDPRFIARRLMVTASEDVGMADPMALLLATSAAQATEKLGLPEARIPLAQATLYVARAPKNNQAIVAIDAVLHDIKTNGRFYPVPQHLKDAHYADAKTRYGHGVEYHYTHNAPQQAQTFLPDALLGKHYVPPLV
jgi:putative ATPase